MRHLRRGGGPHDEIEIDSAGTGAYHVGRPPDARATAAALRARHRARGRRPPGRPRGLRDLRPAAGDGRLEPAASCGATRRTTTPGARSVCCGFDPRGGRRGPRRARPVLRRPARVRAGPRPWSRRPAGACSTSSRRPPGAAPARARTRLGRVPAPGACAAATSTRRWAVELEGGGRAFVKTRAGAPPGEYAAEAAGLAWLGEPGAARAARSSRSTTVPRARVDRPGRSLGERRRSGAGWRRCTRPAPPRSGPRGRCVWGRSCSRASRATTGRRSTRSGVAAARRPARERGALSAAGRAPSSASAERMAELAGPPEPPARLHGDLWAAT